MANNQVLRVLIGCNRQLLLIKIFTGISNIFKKVRHLLKLPASSKGIKQMLFLLFLNFLTLIFRVTVTCWLFKKNLIDLVLLESHDWVEF